jgi:hypothetical protein
MREMCYAPLNLYQVAEQCTELARLFGEPLNSMFVTKRAVEFDKRAVEFDNRANLLERLSDQECDFHSHVWIRRIIRQRNN